ncbi:MAG: serine/threonine protein kinase [Planctomycetaceae bacterium]|nr:serine/threonine protein kinase [Planctomycetaceae bacterium]
MTPESNSSSHPVKVQASPLDATIPPDCNLSDAAVLAQSGVHSAGMPREFDGYELQEEIARGGMGIVYRAYQKSLDRVVALKTVLAGKLASADEIHLFHTEARAAGRLNHPGIVPVYDVGECHGFHYFSMPLINGVSLGDRVARGPIDPDEAARYIKSAAETIQFAHDHDIVHRDLKPGNILINADGRPMITDFGISRRIDDRHAPGEAHSLAGTAEYMPPEQASGKPTGPLSDVYSLGATLYCLLTGRPPFQASNALDTLLAVIESEPVPPRRLNERIPRDIDLICLKCIEKRPQDRYQSAQELADELERFLEGKPVLVHPVGNIGTFIRWTRRKPRNAALATGLVVCFTAALTVSIYYNYQLNIQREFLDMQREVATAAQREAELSEMRAVRLQKTTEELLARLATAESGVVQALQFSTLGEVCSAATNLANAKSRDQHEKTRAAFQTARELLNEKQQAALGPLLTKLDDIANRKEDDPASALHAVDELIEQARQTWLEATADAPGARQQIRTVLYTRTDQLAGKISAAHEWHDAADDIISFLDLVHAELSIVGEADVYLKAQQLANAVEDWSSGPPSDAIRNAARDLRQVVDVNETHQP